MCDYFQHFFFKNLQKLFFIICFQTYCVKNFLQKKCKNWNKLRLKVNEHQWHLARGGLMDFSWKPSIFKKLQPFKLNLQKQPSRDVLRNRCSKNMQQIYRRTPMPKCDFNKVALQFYWNYDSAWMLSCKFAARFQYLFS